MVSGGVHAYILAQSAICRIVLIPVVAINPDDRSIWGLIQLRLKYKSRGRNQPVYLFPHTWHSTIGLAFTTSFDHTKFPMLSCIILFHVPGATR
jgi:hypothetical protein